MRTRTQVVAGLLVGLVVACAAPADRSEQNVDDATPRDLSLLDAPVAASSVLSDVEAGDTDPVPVRRQQSAVSAAPQQHVHVEDITPEPVAPAPSVLVAAGTVGAPAVTVPRAQPTVAAAAPADDSADAGSERPSRGRGILIRGGVSEDDDCALHLPGGRFPAIRIPAVLGQPTLGAPGMGETYAPDPGPSQVGPSLVRPTHGVLVNDRGPRTGLPRAGPPRAGRGGIRF